MTADRRKTIASIAIVVVLGLHAVPMLYSRERDTLWPFMVWAMYKHSRPPGPVEVNQRHILAVTARGVRDRVTPDLLGLSITVLDQRYHRPLMKGDTTVVPGLLERLNRGRTDPYIELHLVSETYTITATGLARQKNPVVIYRGKSPGR